MHISRQSQEMVGEDVVDRGSLQVNQVVLFLHRKYKHQRQHEELIPNQSLFLKYFYQVSQQHMHLQLLVALCAQRGLLRREYK